MKSELRILAAESEVPSDQALIALIERVFDDAGRDPGPVHLFGFSGGAQLAHRFAMLHPHLTAAVYAMAAGWYLLPDESIPYPYGLGDLGPARHPREHGFAKERRPQRHAIDAADQLILDPDFKAMGLVHLVKLAIESEYLVIDPSLRPVSAGAHHAVEIAVNGDGKAATPNGASQAARDVKLLERKDPASPRVHPMDFGAVTGCGHRKDACGIGGQQALGGQRARHVRVCVTVKGRPQAPLFS